MSYILEALRKADAERERDPARGIHAQPAALGPELHARRGLPWWLWAGGGAVALVVLAFLTTRGEPGGAPRPSTTATGPVVPAPVVVTPAPPPMVATTVQPAPPPMLAPPPAPLTRTPAPAVAKAASVPSAPAASASASAPPAAADRVFTVAELPPDVQRDLPKLAITGGVHSDNAAQRMLIVGGQVVGEGVELAPGVVLEQIRPKTAVLRFRGLRYSVPY